MRLRARLLGRIKPVRDTGGSIALEAAIALPVFLFVVLFLLLLIRMSMVQMALQDTASQTAAMTAAHIRPAAIAVEAAAGSLPSLPQLPMTDIGELASELAGQLPDPAGPLLEAALNGDWQPLIDVAATPVGAHAYTPLARSLAPSSVLDRERLHVERLMLPDVQAREDPYFTVELRYDFPLRLPFTRPSVKLTAVAAERVWVADSASAASSTGSGTEASPITIIAIEPSPLRPGRKASVVVSGQPNSTLSLEVRYKSGTSQAKHLGEATTDENGVVSWEWHVSGNTTPGVWELVVTGPNGAMVAHPFEVRKKGT